MAATWLRHGGKIGLLPYKGVRDSPSAVEPETPLVEFVGAFISVLNKAKKMNVFETESSIQHDLFACLALALRLSNMHVRNNSP